MRSNLIWDKPLSFQAEARTPVSASPLKMWVSGEKCSCARLLQGLSGSGLEPQAPPRPQGLPPSSCAGLTNTGSVSRTSLPLCLTLKVYSGARASVFAGLVFTTNSPTFPQAPPARHDRILASPRHQANGQDRALALLTAPASWPGIQTQNRPVFFPQQTRLLTILGAATPWGLNAC